MLLAKYGENVSVNDHNNTTFSTIHSERLLLLPTASERKVMFSQLFAQEASPLWKETPPAWTDTPLPPVLTSSGGHCSGRYASYCNVFLFNICMLQQWIGIRICNSLRVPGLQQIQKITFLFPFKKFTFCRCK